MSLCYILCIDGSTYKLFWPMSPPTRPNSFAFTFIFTEKHLCQRSMPTQNGSMSPNGNPGSAPAMRLRPEPMNKSGADPSSYHSTNNAHY